MKCDCIEKLIEKAGEKFQSENKHGEIEDAIYHVEGCILFSGTNKSESVTHVNVESHRLSKANNRIKRTRTYNFINSYCPICGRKYNPEVPE